MTTIGKTPVPRPTMIARRLGTLLAATVLAGLSATAAAVPASASSTVDPEVWAGSPVAGTWNADAATHHWLGNPSDRGDWASDIAVGAGTPVITYIAPQNGGYTVTARVDQIGAGCSGGADGASFVTVGIYANGARIGSITYAHVRPSVGVGQAVDRWGATIGTVAGGLPYNEACWTGPHVHVQMFNVHNYACFNRGYGIGSSLNRSNFIGFSGGNRVPGAQRACP